MESVNTSTQLPRTVHAEEHRLTVGTLSFIPVDIVSRDVHCRCRETAFISAGAQGDLI